MKKALLIIGLFVLNIYSQSYDAVSLSLAENYTALSRGVYALPWNPANLCMSRGNSMELNILSFNANMYNNALSINNYNRYFTYEGHGGRWTDSDKKEIMDLFEDGLHLNINYSANLLGFAYNNFALSIQSNIQGGAELISNKKLFKTVLYGDSLTRNYSFNDSKLAKASFYSATKIAIGYAYPIKIRKFVYIPGLKVINAGISLNYYLGNSVAQTKKSGVSVKRYRNELDKEILEYNVNFEGKTSYIEGSFPAGNGLGIDLGFSTQYQKQWQFSWSFENLFGSIYWKSNTERHMLIERDSVSVDSLLDDNAKDTSVSEDESYPTGAFSTRLPVKMRIGVSYQWMKELVITMDWHQGFDNY